MSLKSSYPYTRGLFVLYEQSGAVHFLLQGLLIFYFSLFMIERFALGHRVDLVR